jgi:hypothetical protein
MSRTYAMVLVSITYSLPSRTMYSFRNLLKITFSHTILNAARLDSHCILALGE